MIMGVFRAILTDLPLLINRSETNPDKSKPAQADKKGIDARYPLFKKFNPRY